MKTRILKKLGMEPANEESFQIFAVSVRTILKYADSLETLITWNIPVLSGLEKLSSEEIKFIESELCNRRCNSISIKDCQVKVQKLIPREERKKYAAYYTIDQGRLLMASIVEEFLNLTESKGKKKVVIADPFLGSGLTLTTAIEKTGCQRIEKVWGIEPLPLPALVAYAALIDSVNGKKELVTVINGDAFKEIFRRTISKTQPRLLKVNSENTDSLLQADIILTNPPFTRWKYLEKEYRSFLLSVMKKLGYEKYVTRKDISLQVLAMFLCDRVLNENGLLISVLPASTFYTIYGKGCKLMLKEKYGVYALVESELKSSFSEDSGFKEVILVAVKGADRKSTVFVKLDDTSDVTGTAKIIISGNREQKSVTSHTCSSDAKNAAETAESELYTTCNLHTLSQVFDVNWLIFFERDELRNTVIDILEQGLKTGTLKCWNELSCPLEVIRGIEMYGPEFFFIPNKHWEVIERNSSFVKIRSTQNDKNISLTIPVKFLVETLRKPSLYSCSIEARVDTFMLSIPPVEINALPEDLQNYIRWGIDSGSAQPAISVYKNYWFSHVYRQILTKKPFGQIFIPDKVDLLFKNRGVFANYTRKPVSASKNFYIIKDEGGNPNRLKLLAGWFNSTIFISLLILFGRKISETWTRLLENDYLQLPVINPDENNKAWSVVVQAVDEVLTIHVPPLWEQLHSRYEHRYNLDLAIARFLKIKSPEETIEKLYDLLGSLILR